MAAFWVDWAVRSSLLLAMGLLAAVLMRKTSAKHRHALLVVVLLASAMLPLLSPLLNIHVLNVLPWQKAGAAPVSSGPEALANQGFDWSFSAWLLFSIPFVLIVRMGASWLRLNRLSQRTLKKSRLDDVAVCITDDPRVKTAMTWGWLQPRIVMPASAKEWPKDRMASVLQHEMAHIARRDWATQQLSYCAVSLLWYNPLAWLTLKRILLEAERAADDLVIQTGITPADYAQHLLDSARNLTRKQQAAYAGVHATKNGNLESRLRYILDPECRLRGQASLPLLATLGLFAALTPLLLVRLEGQAASQSATKRLTKEIQLVAIREDQTSPEGGISISCTAKDAKTLSLKSKLSLIPAIDGTKQSLTLIKREASTWIKRQSRQHIRQAISTIVLGSRTGSAASASSAARVERKVRTATVVVNTPNIDSAQTPVPVPDNITITSSNSNLIARKEGDTVIFGFVAESGDLPNDTYILKGRLMEGREYITKTARYSNKSRTVINVKFEKGLPVSVPPLIIDDSKTDSSAKSKLIAYAVPSPIYRGIVHRQFFALAHQGTLWILG